MEGADLDRPTVSACDELDQKVACLLSVDDARKGVVLARNEDTAMDHDLHEKARLSLRDPGGFRALKRQPKPAVSRTIDPRLVAPARQPNLDFTLRVVRLFRARRDPAQHPCWWPNRSPCEVVFRRVDSLTTENRRSGFRQPSRSTGARACATSCAARMPWPCLSCPPPRNQPLRAT
jgi:hypothetical protein